MESYTTASITKTECRASYRESRSPRLTGQQYAVIRLAAAIGDDIRTNYPEIAEEYKSGLTVPKLVTMYKFDWRYKVGRRTAIAAVRKAICGCVGHCYEPYQGLIVDKSERDRLAIAHNSQTGKEEYERKGGIHALNREQKADAGRKGGIIGGALTYKLGIGCHALPPEVLREHCRRIAPLGGKAGAAASVAARGLVSYTPASPGRIAEVEFVLRLSEDPYYMDPVRTNFVKLVEKVNEAFHDGNPYYTRTTLKNALRSHCRHNLSEAESPVDLEMLFAAKLARNPTYCLPARIKAVEIANIVNEEYHSGRPVRNPRSIKDAIRYYRKQNEGTAFSGDLVEEPRGMTTMRMSVCETNL